MPVCFGLGVLEAPLSLAQPAVRVPRCCISMRVCMRPHTQTVAGVMRRISAAAPVLRRRDACVRAMQQVRLWIHVCTYIHAHATPPHTHTHNSYTYILSLPGPLCRQSPPCSLTFFVRAIRRSILPSLCPSPTASIPQPPPSIRSRSLSLSPPPPAPSLSTCGESELKRPLMR